MSESLPMQLELSTTRCIFHNYGTVGYIPSSCLGLLYMCAVLDNISTHFYLTRDAEETGDVRALCHY